jgi:predicted nucleotidyltransferase
VRADSDVDMGVLAERPLEEELLRRLTMELENLIGRDVDLVDLGSATPVLWMQVLEGQILFCSDARRVAEFENVAMSRYCALNEERKEILQDIVARGTVYAR